MNEPLLGTWSRPSIAVSNEIIREHLELEYEPAIVIFTVGPPDSPPKRTREIVLAVEGSHMISSELPSTAGGLPGAKTNSLGAEGLSTMMLVELLVIEEEIIAPSGTIEMKTSE